MCDNQGEERFRRRRRGSGKWDVKLETCFLLFAAYSMGFYFGSTLFYQGQRGLVCFSIACVFLRSKCLRYIVDVQ